MKKNRRVILSGGVIIFILIILTGLGVINIGGIEDNNSNNYETDSEDTLELASEIKIKSLGAEMTSELTNDEVNLFNESSLIKLDYFIGTYHFLYDYDEDENSLVICYEDQTYIFDLNQNVYVVNGNETRENDFVIVKAGEYYVNIEKMKLLFNIDLIVIKEPVFLLEIDMNSNETSTYSTKQTMDGIKDDYPDKLMMTWEAVYSKTTDVSNLYEMQGLDIISPVWYDLTSGDGELKEKQTNDYINWSDDMGYELWPSVTNGFDPEITGTLLNSVKIRTEFIKKLVDIYQLNNYSGINIDFENIYKEDKVALSQFVAELSSSFHREGLIVSMDVTFAGGSDTWSKCYDRKILGQWVDYIIVMAYDEHWGSSPISGSVASLNWVEDNLIELIKEVDGDKIILGIPFYMRVWFERPSKEVVNQMKVTSDAITMHNMEYILENTKHTILWDEPAGQYYISFIDSKDNALKKIWIEDERSLILKVDLVHKYGLKGIASWRRGYELESIWEALDNSLRK